MSSRIWYMLYDASTRDPLPVFSPAYLLRAGIKDVQDVKAAIHARDVRDYQLYSGVFSAHLEVFRDMDEYYDPKIEPLEPTDTADGLGEDKEHPLVAFVPFPAPGLQFDWTPSEARFELPIRAEVGMLELPAECTSGSGLRRSGEPKTLFCRPQVLEQWKEIYRCCIRTYALLWIVGPPGTGKSCAALAFAYALRPAQWDVIWIHLARNNNDSCCVWLRGNEKRTGTLDTEKLESQLLLLLSGSSSGKNTIVFLDGYDHSVVEWGIVCNICIQWRLRDVNKHRLVCVTSMHSAGDDFRREFTYEIPSNAAVTEAAVYGDMEIAARLHRGEEGAAPGSNRGEEGAEGGVDGKTGEGFRMFKVEAVDDPKNWIVYNEMKFDVVSWSFEDYTQALQDVAFFQKIRGALTPNAESNNTSANADRIMELLELKHCVVGGSARLMFSFSTVNAVKFVDNAISHLRDISDMNHLLGLYPGTSGDFDIRLMSAYVARRIAVTRSFAALKKIARARGVNSVLGEWLFEGWVLSTLNIRGLECVMEGILKVRTSLKRSDVIFFDPSEPFIAAPLKRPVWMTPVQWSQAGYDAVLVDTPNGLVQFIQVTHADHRCYRHRYFVELLHKLATHDDLEGVRFKRVQLYFVVPMDGLSDFDRPVKTADFRKNVVHGVSSRYEKCKVEVRTLGVHFKRPTY